MFALLERIVLIFLTFACLSILQAKTSPSKEEIEQWFQSDEMELPSKSSDSQLTFIPSPNKPVLHSLNKIIVTPGSIKTGWVELEQCYEHLDPVPDMEVTYQYKNMRKLKISYTKNIQHAFVQDDSVQLGNVSHNAKLCVTAEVKIFYANSDGTYRLVNGPYHRQFLDSFFPYHLTMDITYPSSQLEHIASKPKSQAGFVINKKTNTLNIDTHFTGKLYTEFTFRRHSQ